MDAYSNLSHFNNTFIKAVQEHWPALVPQSEQTVYGIAITSDTTRIWAKFVAMYEAPGTAHDNTIRYEVEVYHRSGEQHWKLSIGAAHYTGETGLTAEYQTSKVETPTDLAVRIAEEFNPTMLKLGEAVEKAEKESEEIPY